MEEESGDESEEESSRTVIGNFAAKDLKFLLIDGEEMYMLKSAFKEVTNNPERIQDLTVLRRLAGHPSTFVREGALLSSIPESFEVARLFALLGSAPRASQLFKDIGGVLRSATAKRCRALNDVSRFSDLVYLRKNLSLEVFLPHPHILDSVERLQEALASAVLVWPAVMSQPVLGKLVQLAQVWVEKQLRHSRGVLQGGFRLVWQVSKTFAEIFSILRSDVTDYTLDPDRTFQTVDHWASWVAVVLGQTVAETTEDSPVSAPVL